MEVRPGTVALGTVRVDPPLWERFVAGGGTWFDTARHYGDVSEGALGAFLERHRLRSRVVIVGKGAHPPECAPDAVAPQLARSLELLRTDHVDLYLLHRDDPAVAVDEWADALRAEVAAGRASEVGVSNWEPARVDELRACAAARGWPAPALVSSQLSLAEMVAPVWAGSRCAFGDRDWHERTGTPLLAWSAAARGFFSGRGDDDDEVVRCWLSPENRLRRRRAAALAAANGVESLTVALAWTMAQRFATVPVVGPRTAAELDACLAARELRLTVTERDLLAP